MALAVLAKGVLNLKRGAGGGELWTTKRTD